MQLTVEHRAVIVPRHYLELSYQEMSARGWNSMMGDDLRLDVAERQLF